jgi:D-alanine-D-alanine ligase
MGEYKAVASVMDGLRPVYQALTELGYAVTKVPLCPPLEEIEDTLGALQTDLVFNLFEGFEDCPETEAVVADILYRLGLHFTGNPSAALSLALDKAKAKAVLESQGIPTPAYQVLSPENLDAFHLRYPCIVKPLGEDASHGLSENSVVQDADQLARQVHVVGQHFGPSLVEEFLSGREFNCAVVGNAHLQVLPVAEMVYSLPPECPRLLTFAAKWYTDSMYYKHTRAVCPAQNVSEQQRTAIIDMAKKSFTAIGCYGYARVDMREDAQGVVNVLEANPNPDISPGYGVARQARAAGYTYRQLCDKIVQLALEKQDCRP